VSPRGRPSRKQRERKARDDEQRERERPPRPIAESRELEVQPAEAGQRLDRLLAQRLPELSRARVQQLIAQGLVLLGGKPVRASERPAAGARVQVQLPAVSEAKLEPAQLDLPVLYEDGDLLVIDKPAGIAVHPGAGVTHATVVHGLLHQVRDLAGIGGELRPGIVHRLDRETSGCLAVAKTEPALRGLQAQFKARKVQKRYLALVHGEPAAQGELDTPYGRHPIDRKRFSSKVAEGRRAVTRWRVLGRAHGASLLEVDLLTGRTHQIRAHFADAGFPLLADRLYGGTKREARLSEGSPLRRAAEALGRQALHARSLQLSHPVTGVTIACTAPLPADLRRALEVLGIDAGA
jgi:23S rRNA pseudouridine1911/1915/1917 synthase